MIIVGSQRAGARALATHLMNRDDNNHVTVQELRGFMSENLAGALDEIDATARGTRCKQFMFSMSINPPKDKEVGIDVMIGAANWAEDMLDLVGQPRAVVSREKNGRRHIHVVWSRIDPETMTAINLPHYKYKLRDLSVSFISKTDGIYPKVIRRTAGKIRTISPWRNGSRPGASVSTRVR